MIFTPVEINLTLFADTVERHITLFDKRQQYDGTHILG